MTVSMLALLFALKLRPAAAALAEDFGATPSALATDDTCSVAREGGEADCAVSALQRRAGKSLAAAVGADGASADGGSTGHPVVRVEAYRAMNKDDLSHDFANVDMATIGGVMNYLHTDVVGEHVGDYAGYEPQIGYDSRLNGIDVITGVQVRVKNPDTVIDSVGNFVDFALSAHFIDGEATGPAYNWNFGDIVGAQKGEDPRYPFHDPYYRFSLSGYCPNLKFEKKKAGAIAAIRAVQERENAPEGGRRRRRHAGVCMTYAERVGLPYGEVLKGGLCANGTQPGRTPTGSPGCVYTYETPTAADVVSLDELVGITKEDCGGRHCKDWQDWRRHCTNTHYHRKFNYKSRRRYSTLLKSKACVEYDIHKACAKSCDSEACQKVPADRREVGLPFWLGRCSAIKNAQRAERLAQAFGISGAGQTHGLLRAPTGETCLSSGLKMCHPNVTTGGMYCSRLWGGVCQPCYIPGTVEPYPDAATTPMCPWNVLRASGDYASNSSYPNCSSNLPRDLCCLYGTTCNATLTSDPLPLTEDGFAVVASQQDIQAMVNFLKLAAYEALGLNVTDLRKFESFAYWQWSLSPLPGKTLEHVLALVKHYFP